MSSENKEFFKAIPNHLAIVINKVYDDPDSLTDDQIKTLNNEFPVLYGDLVILRKRIVKLENQQQILIQESNSNNEKNLLMSTIKAYKGYIISAGTILIVTLTTWFVQLLINR
jgi:hypothetical protein